jgi:eukaryotic-like serine/threonine-protein kinase
MPVFDLSSAVRYCVSCRRCYDPTMQFCADCFVELITLEMIPRVVNERYRLDRLLAQGAIGAVFSAGDLESGRTVAVKIIRASALADPRALDRFRSEAQLALSLKNPQIAEVYDFGLLPDANAFLVTEYVAQATLRQELRKGDKLPVPLAVTILSETAEALHSAHRAGLVHRDLKPESIALIRNENGEIKNVKIFGFSFARIATGQEFVPGTTARLQARGILPRTMTYLSPEQFRGEEADLRADIYSLGVIGYEMLGGRPPFSARRTGEFGLKLLNESPAPLRPLNMKVNPLVEGVILRAIEKDPPTRQQRASEFKRDLLKAAQMG